MAEVTQTWDLEKVRQAIDELHPRSPVDASSWLADPTHIVLSNTAGDLALFEPVYVGRPHIYSGHYAFTSRGKSAIEAGQAFIDEIFKPCYNVGVLMGFTPKELRAARWITRRLGFTSIGFDEIGGQDYEIFMLTRKEFRGE